MGMCKESSLPRPQLMLRYFFHVQLLTQLQNQARLSKFVENLHQEKLNNALSTACAMGNYKIVISLVQAGANNFESLIENERPNHIAAFLHLCRAAWIDDRNAIQLLLERSEDQIIDHPRYSKLVKYRQILMPLIDNGKISLATPIQVALRNGHTLAAGHILIRFSNHPTSGMVDWHGLQLEAIPSTWLKALECPNLQFLSLSFNQLKQIPPEICNFKSLIKMQLACNEISYVPSEIFQLPALEHIDLSHNSISSLPEALLGELPPALAVLDLSHNLLTDLPSYFENSGIKQLDLAHNRLKSVPQCVGTLLQLQSLNISDNVDVKHIPYDLGGLKHLEVLSVEGLMYAYNIPQKHSESTLQFIKKRFKSMQTVSHFELVVIGCQGFGGVLQKLLHALSVSSLSCSILKFDNATQFQYLHQSLCLPNSVYLMVWDCQSRQDPNQLHQVLRHLSIYAPLSPVIVAACWKSFVNLHLELTVEESVSMSLWKDLSGKVFLKHITLEAIGDFNGENSVPSLVKLIEETSEQVKLKHFVPGSYYSCITFLESICKQFKADQKAPMLKAWDFWEAIRSMPNHDLSSPFELPDLIAFLTSLSALVYIPCTTKGMQELYVIDRQWFCNVLCNVLCGPHDTVGFRNFSAIVLQEGLIDLLNCPTLLQPLPDALHLFVNLHGIALAISSEKWLIPCLLRPKQDDTVSDWSSQYGIRRQYTFSLTPITFWGRLITHLLINMERIVRRVSSTKSLRDSALEVGVVDWAYCASGIVCWKDACDLVYSIEAISTRSDPFREGLEIRVPNTPTGHSTMQILTYTIDSILSNWYPTIWKSLELWAPCTYCIHKQNQNIPSILFQDCLLAVSKGVGVKCIQHPDKIVSINKIVPDLVEEDISSDVFLPPNLVSFNTHDKLTCLSPPPSETVFKGTYSNTMVAIKPFPHPVVNQSTALPYSGTSHFLDAWLEFETIRHLKRKHCPYLLQMMGLCPDPLCLVFPFAKWCSLEEVIKVKDIPIPLLVRIKMVYQLACALRTLHTNNILHRNVCLANILVYSLSADDQLNIQLGGFSEACLGIYQGVARGFHGSFPPPEMSGNNISEYDERVDIFAYAFVAYQIITQSNVHLQSQFPLQKLSNCPDRPSLAPILCRTPYLVPVIGKCWDSDVSKRPFASEVVNNLKMPVNVFVRDGLLLLEQHEYFASAAKFTKMQHTLQADVFICSGHLSGEETTCLSHVVLPGLTLKSRTSLPSEYIICMCCVDTQLWVSFYGKKVRVYSSSTLQLLSEFSFKHHVAQMAVTPTSVYLGLENGVLQVYDVSGTNVPTEPTLTKIVCQGHDFKCIEPLEDSVVCANKNTIFRLHPDTLNIEARFPVASRSEIRSIVVTQLGDRENTLWMAFRRLDQVVVLYAWSGNYCYTIECAEVVNMDPSKVWVLTMRIVLDTVWIGLNTGHILIFAASPKEAELLTHLKIHRGDVRHLLLLHPSYMGPMSIPFASDEPVVGDSASLKPSYPESVLVLSCGQELHQSFPEVDEDGAVVSQSELAEKKGFYVVVLEGTTKSKVAGIEKNSDRIPRPYMQHHIPPHESENLSENENENPWPRMDTWTAHTSESPVFARKQHQEPMMSHHSSSETSDSTHPIQKRPLPVPPTIHINSHTSPPIENSPRPQLPPIENSPRQQLSGEKVPVFEVLELPAPGLTKSTSSSESASKQPVPSKEVQVQKSRKDTVKASESSLLDSCEGGEFDPYVRMGSVVKQETRTHNGKKFGFQRRLGNYPTQAHPLSSQGGGNDGCVKCCMCSLCIKPP